MGYLDGIQLATALAFLVLVPSILIGIVVAVNITGRDEMMEPETMTSEQVRAEMDADYLGGVEWTQLSPPVLRWIATRVKLVTTDPDALRELGLFDPYNPGSTKALQIASPYSFEAFQERVLAWQKATFPDKSTDSVQSHLREEIDEFLNTEDWGSDAWAEEAADIVLLLMANLNEYGYSLVREVRGKFAIVQARKYAPSDRGHWKAIKEGGSGNGGMEDNGDGRGQSSDQADPGTGGVQSGNPDPPVT